MDVPVALSSLSIKLRSLKVEDKRQVTSSVCLPTQPCNQIPEMTSGNLVIGLTKHLQNYEKIIKIYYLRLKIVYFRWLLTKYARLSSYRILKPRKFCVYMEKTRRSAKFETQVIIELQTSQNITHYRKPGNLQTAGLLKYLSHLFHELVPYNITLFMEQTAGFSGTVQVFCRKATRNGRRKETRVSEQR